jgi:uncharacterized membrane protein
MKIARIVIGFGIILIALGVLFQFQGKGIVGPESSFMYYNKDWIHYGITIIISGVMIISVGVFVLLRARLRAR